LNLSARESQNFHPSRKAMIVAHFGFPPSAGPESGQVPARLSYCKFLLTPTDILLKRKLLIFSTVGFGIFSRLCLIYDL
jgi:hypothetical protein